MPIPKIGPKEILLKVQAVGVCGSDLHMYHDTQGFKVIRPVILGHEFAGIVAEVGKDVTLFKEGDRVVSETPAYVCETCMYCRTGQYQLCPNRKGFGVLENGAMAQYVKTREAIVHKIRDGISFEKAALTEPACVAYNAVAHQSIIRPGDDVVVFGPGPIGLMCVQIAKLFSPGRLTIVGLRKDANRLEVAKQFGVDEIIIADEQDVVQDILAKGDGFGPDLVLDAVGISTTLRQSIELVRPGGQITKIGWGPEPVGFSLDPLIQKAVTLQGSFSHNYRMWEKVLLMMAKGEIDPLPMAKTFQLMTGSRHLTRWIRYYMRSLLFYRINKERTMMMEPIIQISLDLTNIHDALEMAEIAVESGIDWIEVGTPLILAEGLHAVTALRRKYPYHSIVADLKTMDGGYLEAEMMAKAGATHVVVMGVAHPATIRAVVKAAKDYNMKVMGDILGADDKVACAKFLEANGVDYIIVHTGFDERGEDPERTPFDHLEEISKAVSLPIQAVGGLSIEQAVNMPKFGAPLVVVGAPLVIDNREFSPSTNKEELRIILKNLVERVKNNEKGVNR
ncbi:orotidine 5'-phosphate decarboxylase / HUMPS family protein [Bacillus sp. N9]